MRIKKKRTVIPIINNFRNLKCAYNLELKKKKHKTEFKLFGIKLIQKFQSQI